MPVRVIHSRPGRFAGFVALLAALALPSQGAAQAAQPPGMEFRALAGGFFPGGDLKSSVASAGLFAGQLAYGFWDRFSLLASVSANETYGNHTRFLVARRVNVYQYDLGIERRLTSLKTGSWDQVLTLGVGMGGRAYDQKAAGVTSTNSSMYGSFGLGLTKAEQPWGIRVELRANRSGWRGLLNDQAKTTVGDFGLVAGVTWRP